jgi:hypothetical protein
MSGAWIERLERRTGIIVQANITKRTGSCSHIALLWRLFSISQSCPISLHKFVRTRNSTKPNLWLPLATKITAYIAVTVFVLDNVFQLNGNHVASPWKFGVPHPIHFDHRQRRREACRRARTSQAVRNSNGSKADSQPSSDRRGSRPKGRRRISQVPSSFIWCEPQHDIKGQISVAPADETCN